MRKKASGAWKRPLAGLLTLAMVIGLLASAPLSASATSPEQIVAGSVKEEDAETIPEMEDGESSGDIQGSEGGESSDDIQGSEGGESSGDIQGSGDGESSGDIQGSEDGESSDDIQGSEGGESADDIQGSGDGESSGDVQGSEDAETSDDVQNSSEDEKLTQKPAEETEEEKNTETEKPPVENGSDSAFKTSGDANFEKEAEWHISKSKKATELDSNYESKITLSLPAADEQLVSDVVFVLDESSAYDAVVQEMDAMLLELANHVEESGAAVKVGFVVFRGNAVTKPLELLTADSIDEINAFIQERPETGGSNMLAGLMAAQDMLESDTEVENSRKYMILIGDGITYTWTGDDGTQMGVNFANADAPDTPMLASPDAWDVKYGSGNFPENWEAHLSSVAEMMDATISEKASAYVRDVNISGSPFIPYSEKEQYASSVDIALYKCAELYRELQSSYHCYTVMRSAFTADLTDDSNRKDGDVYPYGPSFMEYLSGGETVDFSDIQNEIYYLLGTGSFVADYMGYVENDYNFDFVNEASALSMTVGETTYEAVPLGENQYGFAPNGSENGYDYILEYEENDRLANEHFVWTMNVPVSEFEPVSLTYSVRLVNPKTAPGTYGQYDEDGSEGYPGLYTNSKAILGAFDSNGEPVSPQEEFAKPTVSYTVEAPTDPVDPDPGEPEDSVKIDKTATELDAQDQTKVTLSVGAGQETTAADVVFVLDKSTSVEVKKEALAMLEELQKYTETNNLVVKVGVVTFNRVADNEGYNLQLTELNDESCKAISEIFNKDLSSGTNIEAGIRAGMAMLDADDSVLTENKHLVLVTDGVAYMWGTGEAPQTVYVELSYGYAAASVDMVNNDYHYRNPNDPEFQNASKWMETAKEKKIEEYIKEYGTDYTVGYGIVDKFIPAAERYPYASLEAALYMAGKAWEEAEAKGYQLYAYAADDYLSQYPWGPNFISSLNTIGGTSKMYTDNETGVSGMFNDVKNTILYEIMSGTVTDVIGNNFDLTSVGNFELTAGGEILAPTIFGNTVYFGTQTGNEYSYSVTYYPNGTNGDSREQFVWDINVPVESAKPLELTYTLKLVNKETAEGSYTVPTNEDATLTYESTDGGNGSEKFPKPEVTYTVTAGGTETPTTPSDPGSGSGGSSDSGSGSSSGSSSSPTQTTSAQTGDETNILLPVVTLIIAAAVLGTAGTVYYKKKRG